MEQLQDKMDGEPPPSYEFHGEDPFLTPEVPLAENEEEGEGDEEQKGKEETS